VLTPLPGTDLMEQVQDRLITDDYDFFDFIHTVLPTTLPLEDFYAEYAKLYAEALPPKRRWALLRKFRLGDLPTVFVRSVRWQGRLQGAYRDYEETRTQGPLKTGASTSSVRPQ
jgi:hypothetical protein